MSRTALLVALDAAASSAPRPACVYVANHQSHLDYAILGAIDPERTIVLGRASLGRMPLIGWLYRARAHTDLRARRLVRRVVEVRVLRPVRAAGRSPGALGTDVRARMQAALEPLARAPERGRGPASSDVGPLPHERPA